MGLYQKKKLLYSNKFIFIDVGNTFTKIFFLDFSYITKNINKKLNRLENNLISNKKDYFYLFFIYEIIKIINFKNQNKKNQFFLRISNNEINNGKLDSLILERIEKKFNFNEINIYYLEVNKKIFDRLRNILENKIFYKSSIKFNYILLSYENLENKIRFFYDPLTSYGIDRVASILYYYYISKYIFNIEFNFSFILNSGTAMVVDEIEDNCFKNGSISLSLFSEFKALKFLTSRLPDLEENLNLSYEKIFEIFIDFTIKRILKIIKGENIENDNLILKFDKIDYLSFFEVFNLFNKEIILRENDFLNIFNYSIFNKNTINSIIYGTLNGFLFKLFSLLLFRLKKNCDKKIFILSGRIFNIKTFFVILFGLLNLDFSFFKKKEILLVSFNDNFGIKLKINIIKNDFMIKLYIKTVFKSTIFSNRNIINNKIVKNLQKIKDKKDSIIFLLDSDISLKGLIFENIFNIFFQN